MNYKAYTQSTLNIGDQFPKISFEYNNQNYEIIPDLSKPFVIFIYKNQCAYCEMTLKDMDENIENIDNVSFYFLSHNANPDSTKNHYFNISKNHNSTIGKISANTVKDSLYVNAFPTVFIVDQYGIVTKKIKGAVKYSIINKAINKCGNLGLKKE